MERRKTSPAPAVSRRPTAASSRDPGIAPDALQTLDQLEEAGVWLMEEGDDSVFYSDEDQTNQDRNLNADCDFGAKKSRCPVNSVAHEELIPQRKGIRDPGAEAVWDKEDTGMQNEVPLQFVLAEQDLQTAKTETVYVTESAESLQLKSRNPDVLKQSKRNISADTAHLLMRVKEDERIQHQMPRAEPQSSGNRHLDQDQEAVQDYKFHAPAGSRSAGCATLPLPKTPGHSFDHLTSSKYSTVSYRRIRRGNTRQKIEEFECMIINM